MPNFHSPQPHATNMRKNIIAYAMDAAPDCFVVDAIDDRFDVINDGNTASLAVVANDDYRGDAPVSLITGPGDLMPDRGGVAISVANRRVSGIELRGAGGPSAQKVLLPPPGG